jgi:MOSC domain-containing protein YiiM
VPTPSGRPIAYPDQVARLDSVNIGGSLPNPHKRSTSARTTGIDKRPVDGPVQVRDPGPRTTGLGSGLVGDYIGDGKHHGGSAQAVYAYQREDLDWWQRQLGRELSNGFFGENLTTSGIDVNDARIGERWRIGEVELQVTAPRTPCATFRGWMGEPGWVKLFAAQARPGAYLQVVRPGAIEAGDAIDVVDRPDHDVSIALVFRATTTDRTLLPRLLAAEDYLETETLELVRQRQTMTLD